VARSVADRQAHTLAALSVTEAEARLELRLDRAAAAPGVLQPLCRAHEGVHDDGHLHTHVFPADHAGAMDALGAMARRARRKSAAATRRGPLSVAK
jgi:hypothetical protein